MKIWLGLVALTAFLFMFSCNRTDIYYVPIVEKPDPSEIIGTWVADQATRDDMTGRGLYDPHVVSKIVFQEDGHVEMHDMPDWWLSDSGGTSFKGTVDDIGRWKLQKVPSSNEWGIDFNLASGSVGLELRKNRFGDEKSYVLWRYLGDPDENEIIVFVKQK
jgi:hypothetical protein